MLSVRCAHKNALQKACLTLSNSLNISRHRSSVNEFINQGNETIKYDSRIATGNNSVLYAICSEEKLPKELECSVIRETPTVLGGAAPRQVCKLTLIADENKELATEEPFMALNGFGASRAIIVWGQMDGKGRYGVQYVWYTLLDMLSCVTVDLDFFFDNERHFVLSNPIIYENAFDVVVTNRAICGSEQCRLSFDRRGKRVGAPAPFPSEYQFVETAPVAPRSGSRGFYQVGVDVERRRLGVAHVGPRGASRGFVSSPINRHTSLLGSISSAHELISVCWPELAPAGPQRLQLVCTQFDAEASVLVDAEFPVADNVRRTAVHNMADGGILVVMMECDQLACERFSVADVRRGGGGHSGEPFWLDLGVKLDEPSNANDVSIDVSESDEEICFVFSRVRVQAHREAGARSSLQVHTVCVAK